MENLKELLGAVEELKEQYKMRDTDYLKLCNSMKKVSDEYCEAFGLEAKQADLRDPMSFPDTRKTYRVFVSFLDPKITYVRDPDNDDDINEFSRIEIDYPIEKFTFLTKFKPCECMECACKKPQDCPFKDIYQGSRTGAFYPPLMICWKAFEYVPPRLLEKYKEHKTRMEKVCDQGVVRAQRLIYIDTCEADPDEE